MKFERCEIDDLVIVKAKVFQDNRGYFFESFHEEKFKENGISEHFVQDNQSKSVKGTLRGLHYQKHPKAQGKLVRVLSGAVWDVSVDLRKHSKTYLKSFGIELSAENNYQLYIPPGFAHGFYVLSETAEFTYKCTNLYSPEHEAGIIWNDPNLNVAWPDGDKILSEKDINLPNLEHADYNF